MKWALLILIALFGLAQLWPVERSNPPVTGEFDGPEDVHVVLRESCYDCHSNTTTWPWYSRIAPVSWLVAHDVNHAREHLNFSEWVNLPEDEREELRKEIWEEVDEGAMPLPIYLVLHGDAALDDADRDTLREWATDGPPAIP